MKISYIANARMPTEKAHGIQIMKMCEALARLGNNLELVLPRRFNWIKKDPFSYYDVEKNFKIKKLSCLDLIPFNKYLGHLGFWIESMSFSFFLFPYLLFKKADLIYTRDKFLLPFTFFKKNLIFEAHTFPKNYFLYSLSLKRLKGIVVITQKLKDLFIEQGIAKERILVAPDGVDLEKFNIKETQAVCREKLGLPFDKKIVLYSGHLYEWKGADILAKASQYLSKEVAIYFIGGTAEDVKKFKFRYPNLNINIVGHQPYAEIPYWLKAADVLVLPNSSKQDISKYWTSPIKMFEYMSAKRPIVASDLPSIREILNEEKAILFKPDDSQDLAKGIERVLENKDLAEKISSQAFENVKGYTWDKRVKKIFRFINNYIL